MQIGFKMKNVVFLGSKDIGFKCLEFLFDNQKKFDYNLLGVLTNHRGQKIIDYCNNNNIRIISNLEEYILMENVDFAISIQYHQILKRIHIDVANDLTINLHMAPLPEYRGCNQFSFAIINGENTFGTTIHKLEEGIDSGDILFEDRFEIDDNIWVKDLYDITFQKSVSLFKQSLPKIISLDIKPIPQSDLINQRGCKIYYRKDIQSIKKIDLNWDLEKIDKHIRATSMDGFEPPFTMLGSQKIYFSKDYIN
jgi:methionyl-tRNA formyltransferase